MPATRRRATASSTNSAIVRVVLPSCRSTGSQARAINSKRVTGAHASGHDRGTATVFRGQDDASPPAVALTTGPRPNSALQFGTLLGVQRQPDVWPAATGHVPTAPWPTASAQLFCAPCDRSVPP